MRLHYLQHVPFEGPANIEVWTKGHGCPISGSQLFKDEPLPGVEDFDWLVIMGGPMNIYEEEEYPWLVQEKEFIATTIQQNKVVLGICLGAQLISDVLGGKVYTNDYKEIGWYPVSLTREAQQSPVFSTLPARFPAFHWHGDTFHLAPGATRIARSDGCAIQAFEYDKGRVIGLQFHLESSVESIRLLIRNCGDELVEGQYIQKQEEILPRGSQLGDIKQTMNLLLENLWRNFA